MSALEKEVKELIITSIGLEDVTPDDIDSSAPLFGDGLALDSIDALELGIAISQKYNVTLDPNSESLHQHFGSVNALVNFIETNAQSNSK